MESGKFIEGGKCFHFNSSAGLMDFSSLYQLLLRRVVYFTLASHCYANIRDSLTVNPLCSRCNTLAAEAQMRLRMSV